MYKKKCTLIRAKIKGKANKRLNSHRFVTVNSLFVAMASITIVCSRIDDDDGKVGVRL